VIKTWIHRCQEHPDHQTGMVSHQMIALRMQEEIDDLRAALAQPEQLVVGGDDLPTLTKWTPQRKPLRTVIYACPICAASLERQE
jgi:hypothetical protein